MPRPLCDFELLSFDCYGTLIDWETGIWDALQPLLMSNDANEIHRREALGRFATQENRLQTAHPTLAYPLLLERVHQAIAGDFGLATTAELDRGFGGSVPDWPAFADSADALRFLQRRYRLVILSNVDRDSFAGSNRRLGVRFDAIYTAQDIGSYKPDLANFDYLLERVKRDFGVSPDRVLHTAQSLHHDHAPARARGLANVWIDRQGLSDGGGWGATAEVRARPKVDYVFHSMAELADAVQRAEPQQPF